MPYQECEEDHQCDDGQFCYKQNCADCIECKAYHRVPSGIWTCPKDPTYCGDCMPGFENENLTEGKVKDICVPKKQTQNEPQFSTATWCSIIIPLALLFLFGLVYFFWYKKRKANKISRRVSVLEEGAQEECVSFMTEKNILPRHLQPPSAPPLSVCGSTEKVYGNVVPMCYASGKQENAIALRAIPYKDPSSPYNSLNIHDDEDIDLSQSDDEDPVELHHPSPPDLHEDSTNPSNWTPGPLNIHDDEDAVEVHHPYPPDLHEDSTNPSNWTPGPNYGQEPSTADAAAANADLPAPPTALATINETNAEVEQNNQEEEEEESVEDRNLNDSGVSDNSHQTSTSSLERPFRHLGASTSGMEEARGVTRSLSEEDLSAQVVTKRQRHDALSLDEGAVADMSDDSFG